MKNETTKQKIIRKLCSRKLWVSIVAFVTGVLIQCGVDAKRADSIGGSIMSAAAIIAYCVGEGLADGNGGKS